MSVVHSIIITKRDGTSRTYINRKLRNIHIPSIPDDANIAANVDMPFKLLEKRFTASGQYRPPTDIQIKVILDLHRAGN
ncbi:hypothetical protein RSOL_495220, partial [Rhizoctonia solani AG-3 Rhs1AP]